MIVEVTNKTQFKQNTEENKYKYMNSRESRIYLSTELLLKFTNKPNVNLSVRFSQSKWDLNDNSLLVTGDIKLTGTTLKII